MSWLTDLPTLLARLSDLSALLHEQNGLLRELLNSHGVRPKTSPTSVSSRTAPPQPPRRRTEKDVMVVTSADRRRLQEEEARKQTRQVPPVDSGHLVDALIRPSDEQP